MAVILFNFQNDMREPYTTDFAAGVYFNNNDSVANYFAEQSYGQLSMTGQVFGWYTIDYNNTGCDWSTWGAAAKAKAQASGANFSGFTNFVYAFASAPGCGWAGLAYVPGSGPTTTRHGPARQLARAVAQLRRPPRFDLQLCRRRIPRQPGRQRSNCTLSEYGDPFSVMGSAYTRHSHAWHKAQMGWLGAPGDRQNVTTAGDYTVGRRKSRLPRPSCCAWPARATPAATSTSTSASHSAATSTISRSVIRQ